LLHSLKRALLACSAALIAATLLASSGAAQAAPEASATAADSTAAAPPSAPATAPESAPAQPPAEFAADSTTAPALPPPGSDSLATGPQRIGEISVAGNTRTESERVIRTFEIAPGSRYNKDALRRGIRKLFTLGLFQDVWLTEAPHGDVVDIVVNVVERPRITAITFVGNKKRETSELEKKLTVRVGEILTPTTLQTQVDSLTRYYHDEGYSQAHVQAIPDTNQTKNDVTLRIQISEGEKVRITNIEFHGMSAYNEDRLRKALKTRKKGLFGGGDVKDETFAEDRQRLEALYHNNGYRDARVEDVTTKAGAGPRDLTMVVTVTEGPKYKMGVSRWVGATVIDTTALKRIAVLDPGDTYNASRIQRARDEAFGMYAEHGYLYVNIEAHEEAHDNKTVDVTYVVTEGAPSFVRRVNIEGNRNTRERVIRREIGIHEGDLFKRSSLISTREDVMRLGIFEDVMPDLSPAESTDVDVVIKVKEKQVGTASAGAGYTGESGVTGFLELSHNNVLGNGQSLALHLERGGRVENYSLSFTEPWFRGSRTLFGVSGYDTRTNRDYYDEKRVGGSVRLGRPLPWMRNTRGSITYRLENVTIDATTLTHNDSLALAGQTIGVPVLTSSMETVLNRNTTDNPFYPTKGTRLDLDDEWAGGPFGGKVEFHKHRYEARAYLPSFTKKFTTMLRARVGLLGSYGHNLAPTYERFRLGGGSTLDPLRGYDDYQIVPTKFIQDTYSRVIASIDTVGGVPDTTYRSVFTGRVRYPGGNFMTLYTAEQQFPIVQPLHGVIFFDAVNTWDLWREIKPFDLKMGAGVGLRMEIPLLGNIGLDYGYGFNRDDGPHARAHFLFGNVNF